MTGGSPDGVVRRLADGLHSDVAGCRPRGRLAPIESLVARFADVVLRRRVCFANAGAAWFCRRASIGRSSALLLEAPGLRGVRVQIRSGIRQGGPALGSVFAFAIAPALRRIVQLVAFADEAAVHLHRLLAMVQGFVRELADVARAIRRSSGDDSGDTIGDRGSCTGALGSPMWSMLVKLTGSLRQGGFPLRAPHSNSTPVAGRFAHLQRLRRFPDVQMLMDNRVDTEENSCSLGIGAPVESLARARAVSARSSSRCGAYVGLVDVCWRPVCGTAPLS